MASNMAANLESDEPTAVNATSEVCNAPHQRPQHIMWLFVSVCVFGILGNTFSILLVAKKRRGNAKILSDIYRIYVIALAVADNGMLFFTGILRYVVIAWLYKPVQAEWWYETNVCRWHRFFMHTFHNASVWLLVVMTFDRFLAVCCPFIYREMKHQPNNAKKIVAVVFLLAFGFATPFIAVGPLYKTENVGFLKQYIDNIPVTCLQNQNFCLVEHNQAKSNSSIQKPDTLVSPYDCVHPQPEVIRKLIAPYVNSTDPAYADLNNVTIQVVAGCSLAAYMSEDHAYVINVIFHIILAFLLPYFALTILNFVIFWKLNCRKLKSTVTAESRQRLNRRITIMMLTVCGTFILLWLPQVLTLLSHVDAHAHNCDKDSYFSSLAALSGITNSALNFILYCLTVAKFRLAAARTLHLDCCLSRQDLAVQSRFVGTARESGRTNIKTWRVRGISRKPAKEKREKSQKKEIEGDKKRFTPT